MLTAMDRIPGRPLLFLFLVLGGWIGGRALNGGLEPAYQILPSPKAATLAAPLSNVPLVPQQWQTASPIPELFAENPHQIPAHKIARTLSYSHSSAALPWAAEGQPPGISLLKRVAPAESPINLRGTTPRPQVLGTEAGSNSSVARIGPDVTATGQNHGKRVSVYAYGFWRASGTPVRSGLAPAPQYGGSQAGLIAKWDPIGAAQVGPALLVRTSFAPSGNQREIAMGITWQAIKDIPVSLTVERRFRWPEPDAFSGYLSGGIDNVKLVGPAKLQVFAQGGYLAGKSKTGFFDIQSRANLPVADIGKTQLFAGTGIWAGGQRGGSRLDIGPSFETVIPVAQTSLRLSADWRFRVAGRASPASGPTLTVSSGF
jgi:hypothetical protein